MHFNFNYFKKKFIYIYISKAASYFRRQKCNFLHIVSKLTGFHFKLLFNILSYLQGFSRMDISAGQNQAESCNKVLLCCVFGFVSLNFSHNQQCKYISGKIHSSLLTVLMCCGLTQ